MNITIHYFLDRLQDNGIILQHSSTSLDLPIRQVQLYKQDTFVPSCEILYIISEHNFSSLSSEKVNNLNFIVLLDSSKNIDFLSTDECNIAYVQNTCNIDILNTCLYMFSEYQKDCIHIMDLYRLIHKTSNYDELLDLAYSFLKNPLLIRDSSFKILGYTKNVSVDDFIWNTDVLEYGYNRYLSFKYLMEKGMFSLNIPANVPIYHIITDNPTHSSDDNFIQLKHYSQMKYFHKTIYEHSPLVKMGRLWVNICSQGKIIGQLVLIEAFKKIEEKDIFFAVSFAEVIAFLMEKKYQLNLYSSTATDKIFSDLIKNEPLSLKTLDERKKFISLDLNQPKRIFVLTLPTGKINVMALNYIRGFFDSLFTTLCCFIHDRFIISVVAGSPLNQSQLDNLTSFLEDTKMIAGGSYIYESLLDTYRYYKQALASIDSIKSTSKRIQFYDESRLHHMLSLCSTNGNLIDFCHPGVHSLLAYDRLNDTDYMKILQAYMFMLKKHKELSEHLHLHRNTLYYKLKKIEEIAQVNLDDSDDFFNIFLSLKILEFNKDILPFTTDSIS